MILTRVHLNQMFFLAVLLFFCRMVVRLLLLWSISFVLAAAPLFPFDYFGRHFYGTNGVCLSLHIHDPYAKVSVLVVQMDDELASK